MQIDTGRAPILDKLAEMTLSKNMGVIQALGGVNTFCKVMSITTTKHVVRRVGGCYCAPDQNQLSHSQEGGVLSTFYIPSNTSMLI